MASDKSIEDEVEDDKVKPTRRKVWKLIRPKEFKIADEATRQRILNPPPRYPKPEFKGQEYIHGPEIESPYLFMCNEPNCGIKFTTPVSLSLHSKKHNDPRMKCNFCGLNFKTEFDMTQHCDAFHPDLNKNPGANPLQCKKCNKISRDKKALWRHVRESHKERKYPCPHCNFPFTRPENLKQHLEVQHLPEGKERKHKCDICGIEYIHKNSLRGHIRRVHRGAPVKTYRCVICSTIYNNVQCYTNHMKRHVDPKYFPCLVCNAKFRNKSHLNRHNNSFAHIRMMKKAKRSNKSGTDLYPVPVIKTVKTTNPNLSKEELVKLCMKTTVKIQLHRVDQEIAERSIAKIENRKRRRMLKASLKSRENKESEKHGTHLSSTSPTKKTTKEYLNCFYCQKELPDLDTVKSHEKACFMKMRTPKLIICPECNKEFDKPYKLTLHARTHTNDKPFQCSYCDSRFKSHHTRAIHVKRLHYDIRGKPYKKVYKCSYEGCDKHYTNHTSFKEHIESDHLGIRYSCKECGRIFRRDSCLRKHLRHVHAECPILLECKPCNRTYKDRITYTTHLQRKRHARKTLEYERRQKRKNVSRKEKVLSVVNAVDVVKYNSVVRSKMATVDHQE